MPIRNTLPKLFSALCRFGASLVCVCGLLLSSLSLAQQQDAPAQNPPRDRLPAQKPRHEILRKAAADALAARQYDLVITNADQCIQQFRVAADQIQLDLATD